MGTFKSLDDIEKEKLENERAKFKEQVTKDAVEIVGRVSKNIKDEKKKNQTLLNRLVWLIINLILFLFLLNLVLLNAWVLRWVIKSLFGLG